MTDLFEPAPQATSTVDHRARAVRATPAALHESSVEPDTLAGEVTTDHPADAGFQEPKKRRAWSFLESDEPKLEREPLTEEEWGARARWEYSDMPFAQVKRMGYRVVRAEVVVRT